MGRIRPRDLARSISFSAELSMGRECSIKRVNVNIYLVTGTLEPQIAAPENPTIVGLMIMAMIVEEWLADYGIL
jgi:hypothetical protein